jgi:hypothetical protein
LTLSRDGLKDATHFPQVINIALLSFLRDFIEPANGRRFQASFRWIVTRKNDLDFDLNGELPALDPTFSFFASFAHDSFSK